MTSALAATLDVGTLVLLVEKMGWKPEPAAVVSYLLGGVVNYILCAKWVFPAAPRSAVVGFTVFTLLSLIGLAITWGSMEVLHGLLGFNYILVKGAALGLAFGWNFASRKSILFR